MWVSGKFLTWREKESRLCGALQKGGPQTTVDWGQKRHLKSFIFPPAVEKSPSRMHGQFNLFCFYQLPTVSSVVITVQAKCLTVSILKKLVCTLSRGSSYHRIIQFHGSVATFRCQHHNLFQRIKWGTTAEYNIKCADGCITFFVYDMQSSLQIALAHRKYARECVFIHFYCHMCHSYVWFNRCSTISESENLYPTFYKGVCI